MSNQNSKQNNNNYNKDQYRAAPGCSLTAFVEHARNPLTLRRFRTASGLKGNEANVYISSVLRHIQEQENHKNPRNRIASSCTPDSIMNAAIDAARLQMCIDSRQHVYISSYKGKAKLGVGWRGYIYRIRKHYPDANFDVKLIFKEDKLRTWSESGNDFYELSVANPFNDDPKQMIGGFAYITYTGKDGKEVKRMTLLPRSELDKIEKKAETRMVWDEWYFEQIKKSIVRRSCKIIFAGLTDDLDEKDNQHFDLSKGDKEETSNSRMNEILKKKSEKINQEEEVQELKDVTPEEPEGETKEEQQNTAEEEAPEDEPEEEQEAQADGGARSTEEDMEDIESKDTSEMFPPDREQYEAILKAASLLKTEKQITDCRESNQAFISHLYEEGFTEQAFELVDLLAPKTKETEESTPNE